MRDSGIMHLDEAQTFMHSLNRRECMELLGTTNIGRFCANIEDELIVLPVNFALFEQDILVRSYPGSKLSAAAAGMNVVFEVDRFTDDGTAGWSVLVRGRAREISVGGEVVKAIAVPLKTWAFREAPTRLIRIATTSVTGRRFERPA